MRSTRKTEITEYTRNQKCSTYVNEIIVQEGLGGLIIRFTYLKVASYLETLSSNTTTDRLQLLISCTNGILKPRSCTPGSYIIVYLY